MQRFRLGAVFGAFIAAAIVTNAIAANPSNPGTKRPQVQLALLLDTSNSMDGLIEQAKSELWRIVNELIAARQNGVAPELHVALYEYGNNGLSKESGWIRMVSPLTTDLDKISEELFKLRTNGGQEYCGQVIQRAVKDLSWSTSGDALKMIVIAGNEPFSQGPVDYRKACKAAIAKGIMVNTIHCGPGIPEDWREGALLADGKAMNIDQNQKVVHVDAPQDKEIARLGEELNKTYVAFGKEGQAGLSRQAAQDANAVNQSVGSAVERSRSKANAFYCNDSWDLVDAVCNNKVDLTKLKDDDLPENLKKMSLDERRAYIDSQLKCRHEIQAQVNELHKQRQAYVTEKTKELAKKGDKTLDQAIIGAIRAQATGKKFSFEN
ncbi:MAG: VWA domain-containing protein [Planctomycetes bacterium]|nr:VWA domain-containing protein [Planctomycetota bacterium]